MPRRVPLPDVPAEVSKLSPKPGDIVVVRLAEHVPAEAVERMCRVLRRELPEGVKGVVADVGVADVAIVRAAA